MKGHGTRKSDSLLDNNDNHSSSSDPQSVQTDRTKGGGTTDSKMSSDNNACDDIQNRISKHETNAVRKQKYIVLAVMIVAAIAVCIVVHTMTKKSENENFDSNFVGAAEKLIASFRDVLDKGGSISSLDVAYTIHSLDHKDRWPFVTLTSFPERSASAKVLSGALFVSTNPVVTDIDRFQFEEYAALNEHHWK
jgi:hypothetical protein